MTAPEVLRPRMAVPTDAGPGLTAPVVADPTALRALRAQLLLRHFAGPGSAPLAVVSPRRHDGRSALTLALAHALAQAGARVAVVEADFHAPVLRTRTGAPGGPDLEAVLRGEAPWAGALVSVPQRPGVMLLPAGPAPQRASALLSRPALAQLLDDLRRHYDAVLVDTPAWEDAGDAWLVTARAGAALALVPCHRSRAAQVRALADGVHAAGAVLVGSVLAVGGGRAPGGRKQGERTPGERAHGVWGRTWSRLRRRA